MQRIDREQLQKWHEEDRHEQIVKAITAIPEKERSYELTSQLARAMNNLNRYEEALKLLLSIKEEGRTDPLWHFRIGYAYYYMGRLTEAKACFEETLRLDPGDGDAVTLLAWCKEELRNRRYKGYYAMQLSKIYW